MRLLWNEAARRGLGHLDDERRSIVDSEAQVMFADSIPATAQKLTDGTMFVELPCGTEVVFERIGDGVQIIMVVGAVKGAEKAERSFLSRMAI